MTGRPVFRPEAFGPAGSEAYEAAKQILQLLRGRIDMHYHMRHFVIAHAFGVTPDTSEDIDISSLKLTWVPAYILTYESDNGGMAYETNKGAWTVNLVKAKCTKASTNAVIGLL